MSQYLEFSHSCYYPPVFHGIKSYVGAVTIPLVCHGIKSFLIAVIILQYFLLLWVTSQLLLSSSI